MNHLWGVLILSFVLFCTACQNDQEKGAKETGIAFFKADTLNPSSTYARLKDENPTVIDTVYKNLCTSLIDSNKFELLHQHITFYKKIDGKRQMALALIAKCEGLSYNFLTKYDSSKQFYREAIALYQKGNAQRDVAECYYGQAMNFFFEGNYMEALNHNYKAMAIYEHLKDSAKAYMIKTEMANSFFLLQDFDKAFDLVTSCYAYYKETNDSIMIAYNESILGKLYYAKREYTKSLEYAHAALAIRKALGDKAGLSGSYNNISAVYVGLKQWDKALAGFKESLKIARELHDGRQVSLIKQNIANCLWHMGQFEEAERLLYEIIDSAKVKNEQFIITRSNFSLANLNKEKGDYKAALKYFEQYKQYNDSLFTFEKEKAVKEIMVKYETNKKEAEIAKLNSEKKIDATRKTLYLSVSACILIIAAMVIFILSNRNKKNRLVLDAVKLQLEANIRELYHFTQNAISKNKLIEELELKLQDKEKLNTIEASKEQLSELYQLKILTEDDWQNFKKLFDKVYPGLISKLRTQYPDLAPAEERQFLLTKLKIDSKECADMLGISVDSVKKNRYRLKKRFNLSEPENLDDFVSQFS